MAQSSTQTEDPTTRTRITTHMNTSHRDSLSLFLQHYCGVPASAAPPASTTLTTLNLDSLILSCQGKRYYIRLDPPLSRSSSAAEVRRRLKALHTECLDGLGLSPVTITRYLPPQGPGERVFFVVVVVTMLLFSRRANFMPGSTVYQGFGLGHVPSWAWFCSTIQPWLIPAMLGLHVAEAGWMARTRLRKHRVGTWSTLWWIWVGSCFIDGVSSFRRIDRMIRQGELEVEMEEKREQ